MTTIFCRNVLCIFDIFLRTGKRQLWDKAWLGSLPEIICLFVWVREPVLTKPLEREHNQQQEPGDNCPARLSLYFSFLPYTGSALRVYLTAHRRLSMWGPGSLSLPLCLVSQKPAWDLEATTKRCPCSKLTPLITTGTSLFSKWEAVPKRKEDISVCLLSTLRWFPLRRACSRGLEINWKNKTHGSRSWLRDNQPPCLSSTG